MEPGHGRNTDAAEAEKPREVGCRRAPGPLRAPLDDAAPTLDTRRAQAPASTMAEQPRPILVTGITRGGTSWVGRTLHASGETTYISEPLRIDHRRGLLDADTPFRFTYITDDNANAFEPALRELLALRYHPLKDFGRLTSGREAYRIGRDWIQFTLGHLRGSRPLVKDPFAVMSIPWIVKHLKADVVITVRHPAAVVSSRARLGWKFPFDNLLNQPLLMRDWLEPHRDEMEAADRCPDDIIGSASLLWKLIYTVVSRCAALHPELHVVRHEDLAREPEVGFSALYNDVGIEMTPRARDYIRRTTSAENRPELQTSSPFDVRLNSLASLGNWRKRLTDEQVERVRAVTGGVAAEWYSDVDWGLPSNAP